MREMSLPRVVEPPQWGGLADSVYETAERTPDLVQMARRPGHDPNEWVPVTAAEFRDRVLAVAKGLLAHGIRFGDRVALMSRTREEWTVLAYALWSLGAQVVPVYPTASTDQLSWILHDAEVTAIVVENEEQVMTVGAAGDPTAGLVRIWQMDNGCLDQLAAQGYGVEDDAVRQHRMAVQPDQTAAICYTSGTTGRPKGCLITHGNLMYECDSLLADWGHILAAPGEQPSVLAFLPVAHCYGIMVVVGCVRGGVILGHQPDLSPHALLPALASFRPTSVYAVPYIFEKIYDKARRAAEADGHVRLFDRAAQTAMRYAEALEARTSGTGPGPGPALRMKHKVYDRLVYGKIRDVLGGRVRNAVSGGSTLSRQLGLFFAGAGITLYNGYGLTETTAAVTAQPVDAPRFGTVGRPLPGCTVHIARDGEVWVRGDVVFAGYLNNPKATEAVLHDGWFATGDLGHLDDDGYLVITGRKKDIIITSGGKSLSPLTLEEQLRQHPLISQCLVVGDDRPYVAALITLDPEALHHWQQLQGRTPAAPEALADDEDLRAQIRRAVNRANTKVSRAESIRAFRILPHEFSMAHGHMTPSMKLRRGAIVSAYAQDIARLYAQ
ncbi:long-chain fatty acid--CoA ligase [Streptomyces sp. GC420]|uniref:AMP-dependent synthetase/ligase n=1 Tax=Streptomyces sp. GC420 TaxID=2697568 RepID=UPI001414E8FE|nr:AMP-dependent synthetase/ligase [Streptomyces sp. GC420]NBM16234.1 AMP-binding protein [Streptomyces sp. GC420]